MIYLAGPINGCTDNEAVSWREIVKRRLGEKNCLDPMRRDYRGAEDDNVSAIVHGDLEDIRACGIMLANCWQVSWGTAMEIFFAHSLGKRVLTVLPEGTRVSPWLRYHAEIFRSLDDALAAVKEG
jgi:nucleoside 2-deoxyribosyltransferase